MKHSEEIAFQIMSYKLNDGTNNMRFNVDEVSLEVVVVLNKDNTVSLTSYWAFDKAGNRIPFNVDTEVVEAIINAQ